jgi:hypothetical protein
MSVRISTDKIHFEIQDRSEHELGYPKKRLKLRVYASVTIALLSVTFECLVLMSVYCIKESVLNRNN